MTTISIENVSKIYDGKVVGVDDISLSINEGEFMALLGPSGCGKTSTLRMIAGLEEISKGTIFFDQKPINEIPSYRRNVAMAFENYGLYPHMSVYENIAYPLKLRGFTHDQVAKKVVGIVRLLKFESYLDDKPSDLSGGVQQRISLARALVRNPSVLLLDEPISHLDSDLRNQMRGELKRLHALNKITTIYVTHDQLEALTMADRIAVMSQGKIRQVGTPKKIFYSPQNQFVATFVGEPPMNIISCSVIQNEDTVDIWAGKYRMILFPIRQGANLIEDIKNTNNEVNVGIRPMDFEVSDDPRIGIQVEVRLGEHLGENTLYHLGSVVGPLLYLTSRSNKFKEGETLVLKPLKNRMHFFSKKTTMSIKILD